MYWPKLDEKEIKERVLFSLEKNIDFRKGKLLGIPGTHLDERIFPVTDIVEGNPFLTVFAANPNHIGLHTEGESEHFFRGTQSIERDTIRICAEEILEAKPDSYDGYITSGGTEANIQGVWLLRNFYQKKYNALPGEIAILHSSDTHYSTYKAGNLLGLENIVLDVDEKTRQIKRESLEQELSNAQASGVKYFIVILNMGTTMFGSVDKIGPIETAFQKHDLEFQIHIDGAFGGFIYPFTSANELNFNHPKINSVTLDAHKMLQAPYGTGVFICRKNMIQYTHTQKASYVQGHDCTLSGSRSGANAISIWMILNSYGSEEGRGFCLELIERTSLLCKKLDELGILYFNEPGMNIVTMSSESIPTAIAKKYNLVSEKSETPSWFKIVVMDHVKATQVEEFIQDLISYGKKG